jgi:hypothetical protein
MYNIVFYLGLSMRRIVGDLVLEKHGMNATE